jgi:hypothetical protein
VVDLSAQKVIRCNKAGHFITGKCLNADDRNRQPNENMPKTYIIPVQSVAQLQSQGSHQFFVGAAKIANFPVDLPLTPNIREPNKKTSLFKEILETLNSAPEKFFDRNNGIKISAQKVRVVKTSSGDELHVEVLETSEGYEHHGVSDGGHTIAAFSSAIAQKFDLKKALVKVEITCGLTEEEVAVNALTANTTSPVDRRSKINAAGGYDFIKEYVQKLEKEEGSKYKIAYYQNQTGVPRDARCSIQHLCKILICLDRVRYDYSKAGKSQHPTSLTVPQFLSPKEIERLERLLPLLSQGLWIERELYKLLEKHITNPAIKGTCNLASISLNGNSLLADGSAFGFKAPAILSLPIIAAFRVFLDDEYQWSLPFEEFAPVVLSKLWERLRTDLNVATCNANRSNLQS